jgi:hypothetical protein
LPNKIPRRIIGRRTQFYEHFKLNEWKGEAQHNKNYDNEIITTLPKKWIKNHKEYKSDTTTHHKGRQFESRECSTKFGKRQK